MERRAALVTWSDRIPVSIAVAVGLMWIASIPLSAAVEPSGPDIDAPWVIGILVYIFLGAMLLTLAGLVARVRGGLMASLVGGAVFLVDALVSPLYAHEAFGTWWLGDVAIGLALLAFSAVALVGTATPQGGAAPQS